MEEHKFFNAYMYFENLERILKLYSIEEDLFHPLLLPLLNSKCKFLLARMPYEDTVVYSSLKARILKEFKYSPAQHWKSFSEAVKRSNESFVQFSSRLATTLKYHVDSAKINKDYEGLFDLFLGNKIRDSLSPECKAFVLRNENDVISPSDRVATLADLFVESEPTPTTTSRTQSFHKEQNYAKKEELISRVHLERM
jgi:hypothetical protein